MPIEVMNNIVGILPDEILVIDPFMGSGTTGISVCEMTALQNANREFVGCEIDEEYFEIARKRIENSNTQILL